MKEAETKDIFVTFLSLVAFQLGRLPSLATPLSSCAPSFPVRLNCEKRFYGSSPEKNISIIANLSLKLNAAFQIFSHFFVVIMITIKNRKSFF